MESYSNDFTTIEKRLKESITQTMKTAVFTPKHIYINWKTNETIVIWGDGTKTVVKASDDEFFSPYHAFTAALAKKIFGNNTQVNRIVSKYDYPEPKDPVKRGKHQQQRLEDLRKKLLADKERFKRHDNS